MFAHVGTGPNVSDNQPLPKAFAAPGAAPSGPRSCDAVQLSSKASGPLKPSQPYHHALGAVLCVPGIAEDARNMDGIVQHLTETGVNENGGVIDCKHMAQLTPEKMAGLSNDDLRHALGLPIDGNVFSLTYTHNGNSIVQNAKELGWATEIVARLTGQERVDLVAHSKGGLDARKYLEDPHEKVGKLITIGTPNKGSLLELPNFITGGIIGRFVLNIDDHGGSADLLPECVNPQLQELNRHTKQQEEAADIYSIATQHDGVVALDSALLPGAQSYVLDGDITHCGQTSDVAVQELVGDLLAKPSKF